MIILGCEMGVPPFKETPKFGLYKHMRSLNQFEGKFLFEYSYRPASNMVLEESMYVRLVRLYMMFSTPWDVNSMLPGYLLLSGSINLASFPVTEARVGGKIELIHYTIQYIIVDLK